MEKIAYLVENEDLKKMIETIVKGLKENAPAEEKIEKLYTTEEACRMLRCSKPTLHRWKKEGIIPYVKIGINIRYKETDLKNLLNAKER